jgi:hypothetical protein
MVGTLPFHSKTCQDVSDNQLIKVCFMRCEGRLLIKSVGM